MKEDIEKLEDIAVIVLDRLVEWDKMDEENKIIHIRDGKYRRHYVAEAILSWHYKEVEKILRKIQIYDADRWNGGWFGLDYFEKKYNGVEMSFEEILKSLSTGKE